jgi:hypothetical protein
VIFIFPHVEYHFPEFCFSFPFLPDAFKEESIRPEIAGQDCGDSDFAESSQSQYNFQA